MLQFGNITIDLQGRRIWRAAREVRLTRKAFDLLRLLMEQRPRIVSKDQIHAHLWPDTYVSDITMQSLVADIRRELGDAAGRPRFIRTVHGLGYAFIATAVETRHDHPPRQLRGWLIGEGGRLSLFDGDNVLGRGVADVIELPSPSVSRRHAAIRFSETVSLEDLGSKNGTFVDDARVTTPVPLANGNRVRIGSLLFTFRISETAAATSTRSTSRSGGRPPRHRVS